MADAVKYAVEHGAAQSQNAFVERALIRELKELRRQRVYSAYAEAAADPNFRSEMASLETACDAASDDGL